MTRSCLTASTTRIASSDGTLDAAVRRGHSDRLSEVVNKFGKVKVEIKPNARWVVREFQI